MEQKHYLSIMLLIIVVLSLFIIFSSGRIRQRNNDIKRYQDKIQALELVIKKGEEEKAKEVSIRKEQRLKDSITIIQLNDLRKRDNAMYIKSVRQIMNDFKQYSDEELDSIIYAEYRASLSNP